MEKLKMHTKNRANDNFQKLATLFSNAVTETINEDGEVVRAIDKDVLMQEISCKVVEGREERYQFTWPEKKKAILAANAPISATLRPIVADSVGKDGTNGKFDSENLYIEGDNLEVLKLLQETYLGKIKMIYIDPPYNTGNDFVYEDDFAQNASDYMENSGQFDKEGNRMSTNLESNGRFHTDWLNMMYPRLKTARTLLCEDGAIFISIDDNEVDNLSKICSDIFGENNFVCKFVWKSKLGKVGTTSKISTTHEYILCYAKNISQLSFKMIETKSEERVENLRQWGIADRREDRPSMYYPITINGVTVYPAKEDGTDGRWRVGEETSKQLLDSGKLLLKHNNGHYNIQRIFPAGISYSPYESLLLEDIGTTAKGATMLNSLGLNKIFDYSKPIELIKHFSFLSTYENDIILDFFSGSATTAHAVMKLNAEDDGHRKFIMVQLPEACDEKSEAFKAGYKNICEIGKERIRRAGKKIKEENPLTTKDLDVGFRCLRLDSSNMKDVYYKPSDVVQSNLTNFVDNVKEDRTSEDLLFQVMLDMGISLSSNIRVEIIDSKKIYIVGQNNLIACFDSEITEETVTAIAKLQPSFAIFKDSSFASDSLATNFDQIFETYSNKTQRKVL